MGFFHVAVAIGAAVVFFWNGHPIWGVISAVAAVGVFWTYGVMHNHATDAARQMGQDDPDFQFGNLTPIQQRVAMNAIPNGLSLVNLLLSLLGIVLLVAAVVVAFSNR